MYLGTKYFLDDVPPHEVEHVIMAMRLGDVYSKQDLIRYFDDRGWSYHSRFGVNTLGRMVDLGVLATKDRTFRLTILGAFFKRLLESGSSDFYDYMHFLHLSKALDSGAREYFWTYWLLCRYLGERDGAWTGQEAALLVLDGLKERFDVERLAIDKTSLGKMLRWLKEMRPSPFLGKDKQIQWRDEAPVRPFLLGIDFYYRLTGLDYGYPLLLTAEARLSLRRIGFLSERGLDEALQVASRFLEGLRIHTSVAGVSIILDRPVQIEAEVL